VNAIEWLASLQTLLLRPFFMVLALVLGSRATPLSDWLVKRTAGRMDPRFTQECERQWLADFHEFPAWLKLQNAASLFFSSDVLEGRRRRRARARPVPMAPGESDVDGLTGMANRRALQRRLTRLSMGLLGEREALAVVVVNLDNFGVINGRLGRLGGDAVLKEMGRRLRSQLRRRDYLGRVGDDEFAIVLPNTSRNEAKRMAERFRGACKLSLVISATSTLAVSGSVGLAHKTDEPGDGDMLCRASSAAHAARNGGRP
jgi:diguanylate cyclase (GGDEF)-like protein